MNTRKRSSRLQDMEKEKEALEAEKRRKQDETDSRGRELRHAKREQTRAERAAEREERAKAKEVCTIQLSCFSLRAIVKIFWNQNFLARRASCCSEGSRSR